MAQQLAKAIALAAEVFKEKLDKGGQPYILHCLRVMNNVDQTDPELMQIAVLHDVIEDSHYTIEDLLEMGFSYRVLQGVAVLTHDPQVPYDSYIKDISHSKDATAVKLADLKDNSDITRLKGLRKKDFERMEKYHKAFVYLSN